MMLPGGFIDSVRWFWHRRISNEPSTTYVLSPSISKGIFLNSHWFSGINISTARGGMSLSEKHKELRWRPNGTYSGQFITTSAEVTPNGLVRKHPKYGLKSGSGFMINCLDIWNVFVFPWFCGVGDLLSRYWFHRNLQISCVSKMEFNNMFKNMFGVIRSNSTPIKTIEDTPK